MSARSSALDRLDRRLREEIRATKRLIATTDGVIQIGLGYRVTALNDCRMFLAQVAERIER